MDIRSFLLQLYQLKKQIDQEPTHEVRAAYLLISTILSFTLFAILRTLNFHQYLLEISQSIIVSFNFDKNAKWYRGTTPGAFPEIEETDATVTTTTTEQVEQTPPASSPPALSQSRRNEQIVALERVNVRLQCELEKVKTELEQTNRCISIAKSHAAQFYTTTAQFRAVQKKVHDMEAVLESERSSNSRQQSSLQSQLEHALSRLHQAMEQTKKQDHELKQTKDVLDKMSDRVSDLLGEEVRLTDELNSEKRKHQHCITRVQYEEALEEQRKQDRTRIENSLLGSIMIKLRAEYDQVIKARDDKLLKAEQEIKSLQAACIAQVEEHQQSHQNDMAKLVAENAELRSRLIQQPVQSSKQVEISALQSIIDERDQTVNQLICEGSQLQLDITDKNALIMKYEAEAQIAARIKEESLIVSNERNSLLLQIEHMRLEMQSEMDNLRHGNLKQHARLQELEKEHDNKEFYLKQSAFEIQQLKNKLDTKTEADPKSKEKYEQELSHLKASNQNLNHELNTLRISNDARSSQTTIAKLQRDLQKEQIERTRMQCRFDGILTKLADANKKVDHLERASGKEKQQSSQKVTAGMVTRSLLQTRLKEQENALKLKFHKELEQRTSALETKVTLVQSNSDLLVTAAKSMEEQVTRLNESKLNLEWWVERKDEELQQKQQTISDLESSLKQSYDQVEGVKIGFETTRKMLESKITDLQAELIRLNSTNGLQHQHPPLAVLNSQKRNFDAHYDDEELETATISSPTTSEDQNVPLKTARVHRKIKLLPKQRTKLQNPTNLFTPITPPPSSSSSSTTPPTHQQPSPPPSSREAPTAKRREPTRRDSLDDLFEGPMPDIDAMVQQDEENARMERELERELNRGMGINWPPAGDSDQED